jgi:cell division topological specificity factor
MASFFERLMGRREPSSAASARERLKLVLVTDRSDLSPEKLEQMQAEIIQVIKTYLQIEETHVNIKLEHRERKTYLVADIPLARDHAQKAAEMLEATEPVEEHEEVAAKNDTKPKRPSSPSRPRKS